MFCVMADYIVSDFCIYIYILHLHFRSEERNPGEGRDYRRQREKNIRSKKKELRVRKI